MKSSRLLHTGQAVRVVVHSKQQTVCHLLYSLFFLGTEDFNEVTTAVAHRASSQGGRTLQTADCMSAWRSYAVNPSVKANYTLNIKTKTNVCVSSMYEERKYQFIDCPHTRESRTTYRITSTVPTTLGNNRLAIDCSTSIFIILTKTTRLGNIIVKAGLVPACCNRRSWETMFLCAG
jgi:hypothetical protein